MQVFLNVYIGKFFEELQQFEKLFSSFAVRIQHMMHIIHKIRANQLLLVRSRVGLLVQFWGSQSYTWIFDFWGLAPLAPEFFKGQVIIRNEASTGQRGEAGR